MRIERLLAIGIVLAGAAASSSSRAQVIQGFGRDVPFSTAARQIVPSGMTVDVDGRLANSRVSWTGGSDWHAVLDRLAASRNADVSYNAQGVRIVPFGGGAQANVAEPTFRASSSSLNRAGLVVLADQPPAAPIVLQPRADALPAPAVSAPAVPAPIVLQPRADNRSSAPVPAPAPIVLQPRTPVAAPPVVVAVPSPATVIVETPVVAQPRETARQRAERLRSERAAERDTETVVARVPVIRGNPSVPRQPSAVGTWRATRGESLDQVLGDWADKAGWTLVFNSQVIYDIQAGAEFNGDFTEAVASLIRSVHARPVPTVVFYRGNRTLVVSNNVDGN